MTEARDADVAVVGAGPAGSALARRLALSGCRVVLVERSDFDRPRVGESLAPTVNGMLRDLGVWARFSALGPIPSHGTCSIWGSAQPQRSSHLITPYGTGWHVERTAFDRMLAEAAADAGADLRRATNCVGQRHAGGWWWLSLVGQPLAGSGRTAMSLTTLRARVLVDATGRAAHVGRHLGARRIVFDRMVAVAACLAASAIEQQNYVLLETSPHGWWYSAPIGGDRMMAMLMTDADLCRRLQLGTPRSWRGELAPAPSTSARIGTRLHWGPRAFPAASQRLHRTHLDAPWLAVGDAALAVDPVSGSGVARALRTAQAAASAVSALLSDDASSSRGRAALAGYEAERDRECTTYLAERAWYYCLEQRWADEPFWRRRAAPRTEDVS